HLLGGLGEEPSVLLDAVDELLWSDHGSTRRTHPAPPGRRGVSRPWAAHQSQYVAGCPRMTCAAPLGGRGGRLSLTSILAAGPRPVCGSCSPSPLRGGGPGGVRSSPPSPPPLSPRTGGEGLLDGRQLGVVGVEPVAPHPRQQVAEGVGLQHHLTA